MSEPDIMGVRERMGVPVGVVQKKRKFGVDAFVGFVIVPLA